MNRNFFETALGAVVLAVAVIFLAFAYSSAKLGSVSGYELTARFDHIAGIRVGGDVQISGIKVGSITTEDLDPKSFQAVIKMSIDNAIKLPADSQAVVASSGLLGDKFMSIVPGGSDQLLKAGDVIKYTQSPPSLESLLGQVVFSMTQSKPAAAAPSAASTPAPAQATPPGMPPKL